MTIETASATHTILTEYASIPISFTVTSAFSMAGTADASLLEREETVVRPYVKDYDAVSDRPTDWPGRFDTSRWVLFLATDGGRRVGGAAVAARTAGLDMLEGRDDLAVLWDIRVVLSHRRRGVGQLLFNAAETWALAHGCRELKVETQNVNVAACRFYAAQGCQLRVIRPNAYADCPGEAQLLWYKSLHT